MPNGTEPRSKDKMKDKKSILDDIIECKKEVLGISIVFSAALIFVLIITIIVLSVQIHKLEKKKKSNDNDLKDCKKIFFGCEIGNNFILGKYNLKKDENTNIFNPSYVGLENNQYSIELINTTDKSNRRLEKINSAIYTPKEDGIHQFKILFKKSLNKMTKLFADCENLQSIDFKNFSSKDVTSMDRTFENCKSLTELNLVNFETSKIEKIDYLFYNCTSLTSINLSNFNMNNVQNTTNMFEGCTELKQIDLTSFKKINISNLFGNDNISNVKIKLDA